MIRNLLWVSLAVGCGCAATQQPSPKIADPGHTGSTPGVKSAILEPVPALQLPKDTRPTHYSLEMKIDPDQPAFSGKVDISIRLEAPRQVIWLHGSDFKVSESTVQFGDQTLPAHYEQVNDDGVVRLSLPTLIGPGEATLHLAFTRAFDPRLLGLYLAHEGGSSYAFTQFEDIFARRAFPSFDEPAFKTPYDVTLVVPNGAVAIANTLPAAEVPAGAGFKKIRYAPTKPLPTYLIAWAVGPFDLVEVAPIPPNALRDWPVPVRGVAPKGRGSELGFALEASKQLLLLEEAYFKIAYPYPKLDSVAVPDYAYGAMENAGAIHYREDLLLFTEGVTSEESRINIIQVMAHEQAHQWFGNLVTMGWWDEAWLNESFATWMAAKIVEQWRPAMHSKIDLHKKVNSAMRNDELVTARAIRQPLTSVKNIQDQFDSLTYQKGAGVLAMFERYVGDELFQKGVSDYIRAHAFGSGSSDDLLGSISRAADKQITQAFHSFLDQAGVPLIHAQVSCAPKPVIRLQQSRSFPLGSAGKQDRTWQVPVCARYSVGGKVGEACTLLSDRDGTLELPGCPDWIIPNADGAGYYRWWMGAEDLKKLRTSGTPNLTVHERISLAQALRVGVQAGTLPLADALEALEPIASDPEGEVVQETISLITFARERVMPVSQRPVVNAYVQKLYAPAFKRLGFTSKKNESTSARRLRTSLIRLLASARSPEVLKEGTRLGRAYAGLADDRFHPEAVDPDLAELVLSIAVEEGDAAIFEAMVKRLEATDDADLRARILGAIGAARDSKRSARALALSLDPKLRKQEGASELFAQAQDFRTRDAAWAFLQANLEALTAKMPETYASFLPYVGSGYCDNAHADQLEAYFGPKADKINGMPKNLRQVVEGVRLCAAQADAQRESGVKFFAGRTPLKVKAPPTR